MVEINSQFNRVLCIICLKLFISLFAILLFGCSDNENDDDTTIPSQDLITISPMINTGVTMVAGNSFEENDAIGLYVVAYEDDNVTPGSIENAHSANAEHIFHESSWLLPSGGKLSWPSATRMVDLYSYYPYDQQLNNLNPTQYSFSVSSDQRTKAAYQQSDFLWSKSEGISPTREPIGLVFTHRLSKIKINVRSEIDLLEEELQNGVINLLNVITSGNVNLSDGSVSLPGNEIRSNILAYKHITPELNYHLSAEAIIMPQTAVTGVPLVRIDLPNNGSRYNYTPTTNISFDPGTERAINITISRLGISVTVNEISPWQPSEIIEGEIGTRLYRVVDLSNIDWNSSFIHHIYSDGMWVGDVCREYLKTTGYGIDAQAIVVYTVNAQGILDLSSGFVAQIMDYNAANYQYTPSGSNIHGGRVIWGTGNSISSYSAGNNGPVYRIQLNIDGSLEPAQDIYPVTMQTTPYRLTDIDGNSYALVKVGRQFWMKENLKVTHYNTGEALAAYNLFDNPAMGEIFGKLYTWDVLTDVNGIAPQGWKISSYDDYYSMYLYIQPNAGRKLKANVNWLVLGVNNNDVTGFSGSGSGMRSANGDYNNFLNSGYLWTTTRGSGNPTVIRLNANSSAIETTTAFPVTNALSVRLLRE